MFKPVAPPPPRGILNLPLPVALPFVLFLVLLTGASLSVVTFAIGAGGLGGGVEGNGDGRPGGGAGQSGWIKTTSF